MFFVENRIAKTRQPPGRINVQPLEGKIEVLLAFSGKPVKKIWYQACFTPDMGVGEGGEE